jgi:hypothetical protein
LDHHQGVVAEPCQSYSYVVIISKIASLMCSNVVKKGMGVSGCGVCCVPFSVSHKLKGTQHTPQPETPTPFLTTLLHINDVFLLIITT